MGSHRIVVDPPSFDDPPSLCERRKYMFIEAFVAQLSIERLNERILNRLARRNEKLQKVDRTSHNHLGTRAF
jgi:hypothetical protein